MSRSFPSRAAACAVFAFAAAGCADRTPVSGGSPGEPAPGPLTTQLRCSVDVPGRTVECRPGTATGARGDLLVGGQNVFVKLRSSDVVYSAPTLSFNVTVQNLLAQAMGTTDGATPAATGVRVFLFSGPTTTLGSGSVTVQNADGTGTFTASGQPYFQYDGVLAPGATSAAKPWQFHLDAGVTTFSFSLFVSAPMAHERGWVSIGEYPNPTVAPGQSVTLTATVRDATGALTAQQGVGWSTSDSAVATVDPAGTVTGVAPGTATITASDGLRSGQTLVTVAAVDTTAPVLTGVTISTPQAGSSPPLAFPGDSVSFTFSVTDAGDGVQLLAMFMSAPSAHQASCVATQPATGTRTNGTFSCKAAVPPGAQAGNWRISVLRIYDLRGNLRDLGLAEMSASGFPYQFEVDDPAEDVSAPALTGFSLAPDPVGVGDSLTLTTTATDAGTGVASIQVYLQDPASHTVASCTATVPATGTANSGTFPCKAAIPTGARPGGWSVWGVWLRDAAGNPSFISEALLDAGGFPHTVEVTGPAPDTVPPTLRSVAITPGTIAHADSATVTVGLADLGTGAAWISARFYAPTYAQDQGCVGSTLASGTAAFGTFTCKVGFPAIAEEGTWTLYELTVTDVTGNARTYTTGDLQALGHPTQLTVTP